MHLCERQLVPTPVECTSTLAFLLLSVIEALPTYLYSPCFWFTLWKFPAYASLTTFRWHWASIVTPGNCINIQYTGPKQSSIILKLQHTQHRKKHFTASISHYRSTLIALAYLLMWTYLSIWNSWRGEAKLSKVVLFFFPSPRYMNSSVVLKMKLDLWF